MIDFGAVQNSYASVSLPPEDFNTISLLRISSAVLTPKFSVVTASTSAPSYRKSLVLRINTADDGGKDNSQGRPLEFYGASTSTGLNDAFWLKQDEGGVVFG